MPAGGELKLTIWSSSVILIAFAFAILIVPTNTDNITTTDNSTADYDDNEWNNGTDNSTDWNNENKNVTKVSPREAAEKEDIYGAPDYTTYKSHAIYTQELEFELSGLQSFYEFVNLFYARLSPLKPGYVVQKFGDIFALDSKANQNDWSALLEQYPGALFIVLLMLALIIIAPFVAVCYCCMWYDRCKPGCPPCDVKTNIYKFFGWSSVLVLLILILLCITLVAYANHWMLDRGLNQATRHMKRGTEDTCTLLQDVSIHIHHLLVKNYDELSDHLQGILKKIDQVLLHELLVKSESIAVFDGYRIIRNMDNALRLLYRSRTLDDELRFYGAQLVDALRGVKRDLTYACASLCGNSDCMKFLKKSGIEFIDTSKCLHFDTLPKADDFIKAMEGIIATDPITRVKGPYKNLKNMSEVLKAGVLPMVEPLTSNIQVGSKFFRTEFDNLRNVVDKLISDIHNNTVLSARSFGDLVDKFGYGRRVAHCTLFTVLGLILLALTIAVLFACLGRDHEYSACSKSTAASCLLFAVMLILSFFSLFLLMTLFYFVMGLITYQGACAPYANKDIRALFESVKAPSWDIPKGINKTNLFSLRMSTELGECSPNDTIFTLLKRSQRYDVRKRLTVDIMKSKIPMEPIESLGDLKDLSFDLSSMSGNFKDYHSQTFTETLCDDLTPVNLYDLKKQILTLRPKIWTQWGIYDWARQALQYEAQNIDKIDAELVQKVHGLLKEFRESLLKVDELLLVEDKPFGESMQLLDERAKRGESFLQSSGASTASDLRKNIVEYIENQVSNYTDMVVTECYKHVGKCTPLAYIYFKGMDKICHRLVNPLNGFWFSVLLCVLLLLPIAYLADYLHCIYKRLYAIAEAQRGVIEGGENSLCPGCSVPYGGPVRHGMRHKPGVQPNNPVVQPNNPVVQPNNPVVQANNPIVQVNNPALQANSKVVQPNNPALQANNPIVQPNNPALQANSPVVQANIPVAQPTNQTVRNIIASIMPVLHPSLEPVPKPSSSVKRKEE